MTLRKVARRSLVAVVVCAAFLAIAPDVLIADTYPRQPGIKITNYTFDYTLTDASNELVVKERVDVQFVAAGVKTIELDLCKFSAQPRPAQMANGFADPCAEPGGGRGGAAAAAHGRQGDDGDGGDRRRADARLAARERSSARHAAAGVRRRRHVHVLGELSRRARHRHSHRQQPARRPRLGHESVAQQGAQLPGGHRSSVDESDARDVRDGAPEVSGRVERPADRRDGPSRRSAAHGLERVGADLDVVDVARRRAVRGEPLRQLPGHRVVVVGVSAGARAGSQGVRGAHRADSRVLHRSHRSVLVRKARARAGERRGRRHGARVEHLLRLRRGRRRPSADRARDGAPVVRRFGDRGRLG